MSRARKRAAPLPILDETLLPNFLGESVGVTTNICRKKFHKALMELTKNEACSAFNEAINSF